MDKVLIDQYIAMPMALTVFKQDAKTFENFKMAGLYIDKLDAVMEQMKNDFYKLKKEIITKHQLNIRCIDQCKYNVNGKIIEYSPAELRLMTAALMRDYLYGDKATNFYRKDLVWKDVNKN